MAIDNITTTRRKPSARKSSPGKKKRKTGRKKPAGFTPVVICAALLGLAALLWMLGVQPYFGHETWIRIPRGSTSEAIRDSMRSGLGSSMGNRVYMLWRLQGGNADRTHGAYRMERGMLAVMMSHRMARGMQTPVSASFNNARTLDQMAERLTRSLGCTPDELTEAAVKVLTDSGFTRAEVPAVFIPDKYEFYWDITPETLTRKMLGVYRRFWTEERLSKAKVLGITPVEAVTIASIIEEETGKKDERPKVARLYLNRLHRGMKLQADPTVKFALGNFALQRITGAHLGVDSPYNTYRVNGLPPGPIRMPEKESVDAVLNAPEHPYIYMCAKEDFSGYHNFATDYATHQANARRYQAELNRRGIR